MALPSSSAPSSWALWTITWRADTSSTTGVQATRWCARTFCWWAAAATLFGTRGLFGVGGWVGLMRAWVASHLQRQRKT